MSHKKAGNGDDGTSQLLGKTKLEKNDPIFEFMGDIDELNSHLGNAIREFSSKEFKEVYDCLENIQGMLIDIGSHTASHLLYSTNYPFNEDKVKLIESYITQFDSRVPPLTKFILPRGCLQVPRVVTRRCERRAVLLLRISGFSKHAYVFLNRLSDLFFVLSRYTEQLKGIKEIEYQTKKVKIIDEN